jgi:hypothetical protein
MHQRWRISRSKASIFRWLLHSIAQRAHIILAWGGENSTDIDKRVGPKGMTDDMQPGRHRKLDVCTLTKYTP